MPENEQKKEKLSIMQPYFLPYIGYWQLIKHTDKFIMLDTVQFIRHGWIERNRILNPNEGWQYISVPLKKHCQNTKILDIKVNNSVNWQNKIFAQLEHYKKKCSYYYQTIEILKYCFREKTDSITKINYNILKTICEYLNIVFNCSIFSEMSIDIEPVNAPDEWALNICKKLNYTEYWNSPGGKEFFDVSKYQNAGINIFFQKPILKNYAQYIDSDNFESGLSIVDVLMFNSIADINIMLDNYEFI